MDEIKIDKLLRSRRRTIGLEITTQAELVVRAPLHVSLGYIQELLLKKRGWILKKQAFLKDRKALYSPKQFREGEMFYFLGKPYPMREAEGRAISLTDHLEFPKAFMPYARLRMARWYKAAAYEVIKERADHYSGKFGFVYAGIKISGAKKRLGSCSPKGQLNFSWRLIMAPPETVDYVVVHELSHLKENNHARAFWNMVGSILPDYKERAKWLKENNGLMHTI